MMNVNVVFYAASATADATLAEIALQHCLTTRRYLVRGDGSVAHEAWFDTATGEHQRSATHQGWRRDLSWASRRPTSRSPLATRPAPRRSPRSRS